MYSFRPLSLILALFIISLLSSSNFDVTGKFDDSDIYIWETTEVGFEIGDIFYYQLTRSDIEYQNGSTFQLPVCFAGCFPENSGYSDDTLFYQSDILKIEITSDLYFHNYPVPFIYRNETDQPVFKSLKLPLANITIAHNDYTSELVSSYPYFFLSDIISNLFILDDLTFLNLANPNTLYEESNATRQFYVYESIQVVNITSEISIQKIFKSIVPFRYFSTITVLEHVNSTLISYFDRETSMLNYFKYEYSFGSQDNNTLQFLSDGGNRRIEWTRLNYNQLPSTYLTTKTSQIATEPSITTPDKTTKLEANYPFIELIPTILLGILIYKKKYVV